MKDLQKLTKDEARLPEENIHSIPAFHVSQSHSVLERSTRGRRKWVFLLMCSLGSHNESQVPQPEA